MNRIRRELDAEFGPGEKLVYGEPWRAADSPWSQGTHPALKSCVGLPEGPEPADFRKSRPDSTRSRPQRDAAPAGGRLSYDRNKGLIRPI